MPENTNPRIAASQLNSSESVEENLRTSFEFLASAKDKGAHCAVLPENFAWMGDENRGAEVAEHAGKGPVQEFLSQSARELGLWIFAGSHKLFVPGDEDARLSNTMLVFDPEGQQRARYDKIHLFDADINDGSPYRESATFKPGESLVVVDTGVARVGLSICYDLRFPELYQALRAKGADIILVPAAFTVPTGQAHWQPLLRARAIENQAYILAPAQCGIHSNDRKTWGHSLCIDPWGEIVGKLQKEPGIIYCEFDAEKLVDIRSSMPITEHRRVDQIK